MDTFSHTPLLTVLDSRALAVRTIAFHRLPDVETTREDVSGVGFDLAGRIIKLWDARLWARAQEDSQTQPNRTHQYNLSGAPLLSISVDEGWDLSLLRESGAVDQSWDAKGASWHTDYDDLLRPVAKHETAPDQTSRMMARCVYAGSREDLAIHNQCGKLIELDDSAGHVALTEFGLTGQTLIATTGFLLGTELPDWSVSQAMGAEQTTHSTFTALGEPLIQTDASGHRQRFAQDIAGATTQVYLTLRNEPQAPLLTAITYNAQGQVERETAGNGVISTSVYDPMTARLETRSVHKGDTLLQKIEYRYDPVGNVTQITDSAQAVRFFRNQQIEPTNIYQYDSLYQLVEATGRESVDTADNHRPPDEVAPHPGDTSQLLNYRETYRYDPSGNMLELRHIREGNTYTRRFDVAQTSNRSLLKTEHMPSAGFDTAFDAAGNLLALQPGQTLQWGLRNQLRRVATVTREHSANDEEIYVYDGGDQRVRKLRSFRTQGTIRKENALYLPGLEVRTRGTDTRTDEHFEVICVQAGSISVRCLHWISGKPEGIPQNQLRYSLSDQLGSSCLELDSDGRLLSHEGYLPFGATAWWAARSVLEGSYKTTRYSGKERDASGLYYYGDRYYAPWLQRWINPDPAGELDGLNLYLMVGNNPIRYRDMNGNAAWDINPEIPKSIETLKELTSNVPDDQRKISPSESSSLHDHTKSASNQRRLIRKLLSQEIELHLTIVRELRTRLNIAVRQFNNMGDTPERLAGGANRLTVATTSSMAIGAIAAVVGGALLPVLGGVVAGAATTAAAYFGKREMVDPLLRRLNIGQPVQLRTSPFEPKKVWEEALSQRTIRGQVKHEISSHDPRTRKGMNEVSKDIGEHAAKELTAAAGEVGKIVGTGVVVAYDLMSAFEAKMPYKIGLLIGYIDEHIKILNDRLNSLKEPMNEMQTNNHAGIGVKKYGLISVTYDYSKLEAKTGLLIGHLESFKARAENYLARR